MAVREPRTVKNPFARDGKGKRITPRSRIPTKLQKVVQNNLGTIMTDQMGKTSKVRNDDLDVLDQYYESKQYDSLQDWDEACKSDSGYVAVRDRKPRIIYNVAKVLVDKVAGKLVGKDVFPKFTVEDDPEDTAFFRIIQQAAGFRRNLLEPMKRCLLSGASFVRFYLVNGFLETEWFNAKYCYPIFDGTGELQQLEVKYVFEDPNDKDERGKFKQKWYRLVLTQTTDVLYDNPEYREGTEPQFKEIERNEHGLGWVQGEWFRTAKHKFDPDGDSIVEPILDFIDELNYSLSQTSQAVGYNQDPQLVLNKIDEDELDKLIRSSMKGWDLGREGEAKFLETDLNGVKTAEEQRDHFRNRMLEVVRVVLHDPETMVGSAQSAKAMEVLHTPLVELIDELRTVMEPAFKNLLIKMAMSLLIFDRQGFETMLEIPAGYQPKSLDITVSWPPIFPLTIDDILKKVQAAVQASQAKIISRESGTRWIASDFGIENIDEELSKIEAEPDLNPFGSFGM